MNFDLNQQLSVDILKNIDHPVTKTLIYIHSMETFIYGELKKSCLIRDCSRVKTLGPYAYVLGYIIGYAFGFRC